MNWVRMEYFRNADGIYHVLRYRANGKSSVTPFGFKSKDSAIRYIVNHDLQSFPMDKAPKKTMEV